MKTVVLDTNVLIASAYAPESASRRIVAGCLQGTYRFVLSAALRKEYDFILPRAIHTKDFRDELARLLEEAHIVDTPRPRRVVPEDAEDDKLIALAVAAQADALITNDQHLLKLTSYEGIPIVTPSDFLNS